MRRKIYRAVRSALVAGTAVLAGSLALTAPATAARTGHGDQVSHLSVTPGVRPAVDGKSFFLPSDAHSGDCTMFHGATWTLNSDGTMNYDGVVTSSDDNDAWIMKQVLLYDANNAQIGVVTNPNPDDRANPTWFIKNLPDHNQQYRWITTGQYPAGWYNAIAHISIVNHC